MRWIVNSPCDDLQFGVPRAACPPVSFGNNSMTGLDAAGDDFLRREFEREGVRVAGFNRAFVFFDDIRASHALQR